MPEKPTHAESTIRIDTSRRSAVRGLRRDLLEAAAFEARRIGRDVDPDDRAPEQQRLLTATVTLIQAVREE